MTEARNHEGTEDPLKIPAIAGTILQKKRCSFADVLSDAVITVDPTFKPLTSKLCALAGLPLQL